MTTTRAAKAEQTRQLILATANRLFDEHGYDATSLQLIADEIGVAKAAVYYHYRTKAEILHAVAEVAVSELNAMMDAAERQPNRRDRVATLIDARVDQLVARRATISIRQQDPGIKRELVKIAPLTRLIERGLVVVFGDNPSAEDRAAYGLVLALDVVLPRLAELSEDELRDALRRTCFRLLRVPYSA